MKRTLPITPVEVVKAATMKWHCIACKGNFQGPTNAAPKAGCPHCGSRQVFDCNVRPITRHDMPFFLQGLPGRTSLVTRSHA